MAAVLRPARSVGGDLYDVMADGDRVWLLVGDVSGKGVGAALFMAVTKTLFRAIAPGVASVAEAVARVNRGARARQRARDVRDRVRRAARPRDRRARVRERRPQPDLPARGGRRLAPLAGRVDPALGAVEGHAYRARRLRLEPRDALVLYTDGVVEARSARGRGVPRAAARGLSRASAATLPPAALVRGLSSSASRSSRATSPQYDDVTVLALR